MSKKGKKPSKSNENKKRKMSRLADATNEFHFRVFRIEENLFTNPEEEQARWLCHALGLAGSSSREDKESMITDILCEILQAVRKHEGLTNDELSRRVYVRRTKKTSIDVKSPSRGTIAYHATRLEKSGLIVRRGNFWELREFTLERTLKRVKEDLNRFMEDIIAVARNIDKE